MTIPQGQLTLSQYEGNGATAIFDYAFKITSADELKVTTTDLDDVDTVLDIGADYTVSGVGDEAGGSVTLTAGALTTGYKITIADNIESSQETPFGNQSAFFASLHEASFDKLTRLVNRVLASISGTILRIPDTVVGASAELPKPRALALFRWNADENALETVLPSEIATTVAFSDFKTEQFNDGDGYTSGASTSITLSESAGLINNTQVFIDGVYQPKDTYTMPDTVTIDFGSVISGTPVIEVVYGTAAKSDDTLSLLGTAATADVQTSPTDTTADALMAVGAFGMPFPLSGVVDFDALTVGDWSVETGSAVNSPDGTSSFYGIVKVRRRESDERFFQFATATSNPPITYSRAQLGATLWSDWVEIYHSGNAGTAATANVQTSPTDTTAGALMSVGAFGLGQGATLVSTGSMDDLVAGGKYFVGSSVTDTPSPTAFLVDVTSGKVSSDNDRIIQVARSYISVDANRTFTRVNNAGTWSDWVETYHSGNLNMIEFGSSDTTAFIARGYAINDTVARFHFPVGFFSAPSSISVTGDFQIYLTSGPNLLVVGVVSSNMALSSISANKTAIVNITQPSGTFTAGSDLLLRQQSSTSKITVNP